MQQINLYSHLPHPVKSIYDARSLLVLFGVFCATLILYSGVGLILKHNDNVRLAEANNKFQAAKEHLTTLVAQYPTSVASSPNLAKLAYCKFNFSTVLEAFANAIVPGIWLTDITIADHGQTVSVKGHALVEGQVQLYAEQLNGQRQFQQNHLVLQDITRGSGDKQKPNDELLNFNISTKGVP